jgi:O-antigen/teichoic acid export membrane protein
VRQSTLEISAVAAQRSPIPAARRLLRSPSLRSGMRTGSWLLLGQASVGLAQFGFSMIRARSLSLDQYGQWAFAGALVSIFGVFADFGLTLVLVRELSAGDGRGKELLRTATAASLALSLAVTAAVAAVLAVLQPGAAVTTVSAMYCAQLVVSAAGAAPLAYNRARHDTMWEAVGRGAQAMLLVAGGVLIMRHDASIGAFAALSLAAVAVATLPVVARAAQTTGWIAPRFNLRAMQRLLRTASPIGIAMAATSIYYYFDTLLMGVLGQRHALALYSAAYTLLFAATLSVGVLQSAFLPTLSRAAGEGSRALAVATRPFFAVSAVGGIVLLAIGPASASLMLTHVYGASFAGASVAMRLLFVTGAVMFASSAAGTVMLAIGRQDQYLRSVLAGAAINIVLNLLLIPQFSLEGAAAATLSAEAVVAMLMALQLRRTLRERRMDPVRRDARLLENAA